MQEKYHGSLELCQERVQTVQLCAQEKVTVDKTKIELDSHAGNMNNY